MNVKCILDNIVLDEIPKISKSHSMSALVKLAISLTPKLAFCPVLSKRRIW